MLETWAAHVFRYSGRDQLSVNLAFRQSGLTPQVLETDDFSSWLHSRLAASPPDHRKRTRQSVNALGLSIARVRQAEQSLGGQGRNHQAPLDELKRYGAAQLRALDEEILSLNGALEQQQALNVEKDDVIVTKDVLIAEQREQICRAEDLLADQDARLSESGRLLADRSNHLSRLQSEVKSYPQQLTSSSERSPTSRTDIPKSCKRSSSGDSACSEGPILQSFGSNLSIQSYPQFGFLRQEFLFDLEFGGQIEKMRPRRSLSATWRQGGSRSGTSLFRSRISSLVSRCRRDHA